MLARKGLFIVILISLIGGYFYLRPYIYGKEEEASITDRLPLGNFIGKINIFDLARESNTFLYYNKLPFREFLTQEFLLAQGKNYGLDIQKPIYFFSNVNGEWGSLIHVNDSSKVISGLVRLKQSLSIEDTLMGEQKVYEVPKEKTYMTYGKNWLFLYHGDQLARRVYHVVYSKKGGINPVWKDFLKQKYFQDESLVVYSNWSKFQKLGFEKILFSHDCDSLNFRIKSYIKSKEDLNFSLKDSGLAIPNSLGNNKSLTFHFDIEKLRQKENDPLRLILIEFSKRISFPVNEFLNAWNGDISFHEGGIHKIKETYIETEYDEEFNAVDVKKEKEVAVPGYAVLLSMNKNQKNFVYKLFAKGIMRKENRRFYILTSPPLKINQAKNYLLLYSSQHAPKISYGKTNAGYWRDNKVNYDFTLDSLNSKEISFTVNFPGMSILRRNKFLY